MAEIITVTELPTAIRSADLVSAMVAGANAQASRVAPCLTWTGETDSDTPAPSDEQLAEAKLVLLGAIKRWAEAGSGAVQQQTAGVFSMTVDSRQKSSGYNLFPSEITHLQDICKGEDDDGGGAFSIDTVGCATVHADICALNLGAAYCSCGADIAGFAIYETPC